MGSIITLQGDDGDDVLLGKAGVDFLLGGQGNDRLDGGSEDDNLQGEDGNDVLIGGLGHDSLDGGLGTNVLDGGEGNDTLSSYLGQGTLIGGQGNDTYNVAYSSIVIDNYDTDEGFDVVVDAAPLSQMTGLSRFGDNLVIGNQNIMQITLKNYFLGASSRVDQFTFADSEALTNFVVGTNADDVVVGTSANDGLSGGLGADSVSGGEGDDVYFVDSSTDTVSEKQNEGSDTVVSSVDFSLSANVERLIFQQHSKDVIGFGNGSDNSIIGSDGDNRLYGLEGNDSLEGGRGDDFLDGGAGNDTVSYASALLGVLINLKITAGQDTKWAGTDTLINIENIIGSNGDDILIGNTGDNVFNGGYGNDSMNGGLGNDLLVGGLGLDSFAFNTSLGQNNIDTIKDFSVADDTIRLEDAIFTALTPGALTKSAFKIIGNGGLEDADDHVLYDTAAGTLLYDADGNGAVEAQAFAIIGTGLALTAMDFVVV